MPPETLLAFDTSAAHCAAALLSGGRLVTRVEAMDKGQAERLLPLLEELLAEAGLGWPDLTALVVGTGPGNFTGVRIAVAAARGLALGLGIPAVGVTALEASAQGLPRPVTVRLDARRGEQYRQDFTLGGPGAAALVPAEGAVTAPALPLLPAMIAVAQARLAGGQPIPRPAPFYLRSADAAPPSDPPPVILDAVPS